MNEALNTLRAMLALTAGVWRRSAAFFLSVELCLMVGVAFATVAGVWLAIMGDARGLLVGGGALGYLLTRVVLHVNRILAWPFI